MKKYTVVAMNSIAELEAEVEKAIQQGYKILGGVSMTTYENDGFIYIKYAQAMVLSTATNFVA